MAWSEESEFEYAERPLSEWLADLDDPDIELRCWAASALYDIAFNCHCEQTPVPAAIVPSLVNALGDPESRVRGKAARALGMVGPTARHVTPQLIALLASEQEDDEARANIAEGIAEIGASTEAAPVLLRLLQESADVVREATAAALENADLSDHGVEAQLRACLSDESPVVRVRVCWVLWNLTGRGEDLVPTLLETLGHERSRFDSARLLCRLKVQAAAALRQLLALRDDPHWGVRLQAVRATMLIPCGDEIALGVLDVLRDDPNDIVRSYAAQALQQRGLT